MYELARRIVPAIRRRTHLASQWARRRAHRGRCPVCEDPTFFIIEGANLREHYRCWKCGSLPQNRALLRVLQDNFPNWRDLSIHEPSPGGPASEKLNRECPRYLPTHYDAKIPRGEVVGGLRCEDMGSQTFPAHRFDLVVTVDVFQHLPSPRDAFTEIARTLKPGGAHVFTVPWSPERKTVTRVRFENGQPVHIEPATYQGKAIDERGGLVVTDWGWELPFHIQSWSGLATAVYRFCDRRFGLDGAMCDVFVSRKPPAPAKS